ncbi:MAG: hypothetical protein ACRENP_18085 [Longimicrobiales bacterium]
MRIIRMVTALGLSVLASSVAQAQSSQASPAARAAELVERADQITAVNKFGEKARLYERATRLLTVDDPQLAYLLIRAGSTYYFVGNKAKAREIFRQVAALAEEQKNESLAAEAYFKSLILAAEQQDRQQVRVLIDRLVILAGSATLPESERVAILRRISVPLAALTPQPGR